MIARAIENWLSSTNERNFQTPFCQTLVHANETILYISRHGPLEQGKDVISRHPTLGLRAFQLKTGDIDLPTWRKIRGECEELVSLPIVHPSVDKSEPFRAYLVTNGSVSDEVRLQIDQINEDTNRKGRGWAKLEVIDFQGLLKAFLDAQGDFTPREPGDLKTFLELYLVPGNEALDVAKWLKYLNTFVFPTKPARPSDVMQAVSASVVQVALGLQSCQLLGNHFALFQGWIVLAASIFRFARRYEIPPELWRASYDLAFAEAARALEDLEIDFCKRSDLLEGNVLADGGIVYRARATMVQGALCALANYRRRAGLSGPDDQRVRTRIGEELTKLWYWGESAFPFFYELITFLEAQGESASARERLLELLDGTVTLNSPGGPGSLASTYVTALDILEHGLGVREEPIDFSQFAGSSFILATLIHLLAKRGMRAELEARWRPISKIVCRSFDPDRAEDVLDWRTEEGVNRASFPAAIQSWADLVAEADVVPDELKFLRDEADLVEFFLLACPHRSGWRIISILENRSAPPKPSRSTEER